MLSKDYAEEFAGIVQEIMAKANKKEHNVKSEIKYTNRNKSKIS